MKEIGPIRLAVRRFFVTAGLSFVVALVYGMYAFGAALFCAMAKCKSEINLFTPVLIGAAVWLTLQSGYWEDDGSSEGYGTKFIFVFLPDELGGAQMAISRGIKIFWNLLAVFAVFAATFELAGPAMLPIATAVWLLVWLIIVEVLGAVGGGNPHRLNPPGLLKVLGFLVLLIAVMLDLLVPGFGIGEFVQRWRRVPITLEAVPDFLVAVVTTGLYIMCRLSVVISAHYTQREVEE
jgi:hypothetical protein